ncbi:MAG: nickel pincer cofactor biosynthesis protein LarB [Planctomycetes bacterium]|nr:nickel pincer cofactor biosynthesis protein LarB [Planctomycetota bacterium]
MDEQALKALLTEFQAGKLDADQMIQKLRRLPFEDLGFAKIDHHRAIRCGFPEVIYCEGKTIDQVVAIMKARLAAGGNLLGTRADPEMLAAVAQRFPQADCCPLARTITIRQRTAEKSAGSIALVTAGTSDMPVAEEARVTAEIMDQRIETFYDVGVAGIHRLLAYSESLQAANVLIVVAGMEGALASVVGGLVDRPVIAVPTSVGYGASFHGLAALLAMLNSCASGVTVVNIDNGFAAGYTAALINRLANPK